MSNNTTKAAYDCSYDFDDYKIAKKYRFVVIHPGDLDLNGAVMIKNKKSLIAYLEECARCGITVLQIWEGVPIMESSVSPSARAQNERIRRQVFITGK